MTIKLKMRDFRVSKVSGANSVLDIYLDKPKSSKKSSKWSVSNYYKDGMKILRYFKRIFSAKKLNFKPNIFGGTPTFQKFYFRSNTEISKVLFSAAHGLFKSFIFGGARTFQKFYFRRRKDFSFFFIYSNRADLQSFKAKKIRINLNVG